MCGRPESPPCTSQSAQLVTEDWPEEGLAVPDMTGAQGAHANHNRSGTPAVRQPQAVAAQRTQVLPTIADAQLVEFLAMALLQQSSPKWQVCSPLTTCTSPPRQWAEFPRWGTFRRGLSACRRCLHRCRRRCLITVRFCWPQMARACLFCQRGKVHRHVQLQSSTIPVPFRPHPRRPSWAAATLARAHVPFTMTDRTSRWVARGYPTLLNHRRRLCQSPIHQLHFPFWSASHNHLRQRGQFTFALWTAYAVYSTSATLLLQPTTHNQMAGE